MKYFSSDTGLSMGSVPGRGRGKPALGRRFVKHFLSASSAGWAIYPARTVRVLRLTSQPVNHPKMELPTKISTR